LKKLIIKNIS